MVEILISVAAKVAEYMVDPICRNLSYLFKHHHYVEDLIQNIGEVERVRETVVNLVEHARNQGDIIFPLVEGWLEDSQGIIQRKQGFVGDEEQASKSCFYLKSRYRLTKKAKKLALDIAVKLQQARDFGDRVSCPPPPPPLISSASFQNCEAFPSRQSIFDQIMEALRNKETSVVGVWGMGGAGKTTLAQQVAKLAEEEKLFHKVAMASSISQTPNISEIQKEIARTLPLTFKEGEDRTVRLHNSLKNQETILVILDDIWGKLDLVKIGIPYGHENKGCKLLLTSRDQRVLDSDMGAELVFHLQHLNAEEAWNLFKRTAEDSVESPEIRSIAYEIVEHCQGLPIALVTIGKALKGKSVPEWKNALEELKNATPINLRGVSEKVYSCLELSYNHLVSCEAKSLFLLCGLLEDAHISMDRLLLYCTGLNLFEGLYSWEKAVNKVIALVGNLKASSLLLDPDQNGIKGGYLSMFFDDAFVKMHDVIRDFARSIASKDACQYVVRAAAELREWEMSTERCKNYRRISLECGDSDELLPQRLACTELQLFLLNSRVNQGNDMRIPAAFFQDITNLRVLHLSGVSLEPSFVFSSNLRVLCLNDCWFYGLSWAAIGELKSLQALSLADSEIEELPKNMMQLSDLRVLDLRDCRRLRIIPRDVISSLSRLEYLSLKGCANIKWERDVVDSNGERNNACLSELKHLPKLKTLYVEVSNPGLLPEDEMLFHNVNLTRHSIVIGESWLHDQYTHRVSRILKVEGSVRPVLKCLSKLFWSCQSLILEEVGDIKEVVHELDRDHGFVELKNLSVRGCPAIEYIFHSRDHQWVPPCNTFCELLELKLNCLISLEAVCRGPIPVGCFRNLRHLLVEYCRQLKYVFSFQDPTMELAFPHLQLLSLVELPDLVSFSSSTTTTTAGSQDIIAIFNRQDSFPALESISVKGLDSVRVLWYSPQISADFFLRLQNLKINHCRTLQNIFPLSVAKALGQLRELRIEWCEAVEEIVTSHEGETPDSLSLFPNLTSLALTNLLQLKKFCSKRFALRLPLLKSLQLDGCYKVEILFVQETGVESGGLTTTEKIQQPFFFLQKDAFPALESIYINRLDSLRALWYSPQISADFFSRLQNLKINHCRTLLNIFPLSVAKALGQLQKLRIEWCDAVEEIVTSHEDETPDSLSLFPNLSFLELKHLPQLKKFCSNRFASRLPLLKSLKLRECDKVEILFVQETGVEDGGLATTEIQQPFFFLQKYAFPALESISIEGLDSLRALWYSPQISADFFPRLKKLEVHSCRKLQNIFPLSVAKALGQLQHLRIRSCKAVGEIVTSHEDETADSLPLFPNLTSLALEELPQLKKFCYKRFTSRWPLLKRLVLTTCGKVEILFVQETGVEGGGLATTEIQQPFFFLQKDSFPALEYISVYRLDSVRMLFYSPQISADFFPRLQELQVYGCGKLLNVFPLSVAKALGQLQQLGIRYCEAVEEIVASHEDETTDSLSLFPNLTSLALVDLPQLKKFCSKRFASRWPLLKSLELEGCEKVEILFAQETGVEGGGLATAEIQPPFFFLQKESFPNLEELQIFDLKGAVEIWRGQFSRVSFSKLRELIIEGCDCISVMIIPMNVARALHNLETLRVVKCGSLNEVVQVVDGKQPPTDAEIDFPRLKSLNLEYLPNLKSFCSLTCTFRFPSLEHVVVKGCYKMEFFCQGDLQTPMLKYEEMERPLKQYWETDLNTTIRLIRQAHLQGTIEEDEEDEE